MLLLDCTSVDADLDGTRFKKLLRDAVCAVCIAKQEGEFDERQYYHEELVEIESD